MSHPLVSKDSFSHQRPSIPVNAACCHQHCFLPRFLSISAHHPSSEHLSAHCHQRCSAIQRPARLLELKIPSLDAKDSYISAHHSGSGSLSSPLFGSPSLLSLFTLQCPILSFFSLYIHVQHIATSSSHPVFDNYSFFCYKCT